MRKWQPSIRGAVCLRTNRKFYKKIVNRDQKDEELKQLKKEFSAERNYKIGPTLQRHPFCRGSLNKDNLVFLHPTPRARTRLLGSCLKTSRMESRTTDKRWPPTDFPQNFRVHLTDTGRPLPAGWHPPTHHPPASLPAPTSYQAF